MAFLRWRWWEGGGRGGREVGVLHALRGVGVLGGAGQVDGPPNNGTAGLLRGPPLPAHRVYDAPVPAATRQDNDCVGFP